MGSGKEHSMNLIFLRLSAFAMSKIERSPALLI